ncbi:MAG: FAD-binding oxidoreductase [Acetivibrionales bacterium]
MKKKCNLQSIDHEALETAKNCRHYAMCKIDFLGSGVCPSGFEKRYASFYPVGRMDLYASIAANMIPVTEKCVEIANSCNLCGKCDCQCYFVNEMRPSKVMKALKQYVETYIKNGGEIAATEDDNILNQIRTIVGDFWASNDPAVRIAYHHDLCPNAVFKMPDYVIMPGSKEALSSVVKLLNSKSIPYVVRGNGASSHGLVFCEGAVIDLNRMDMIEFDEKNWCVKVGPGVASFDLQSKAKKRGYRVHTAEPASNVCANIMTSGLLSTFSTTYGIAADNYVDAEFIGKDGSFFTLNDIKAPNHFAFDNSLREHQPDVICTSVSVKLHPVTEDEAGVLVPFSSIECAFDFARDCSIRHIGLAIAILGIEFISSFLAPTKKLASAAKNIFGSKLGMPYLVLIIGDKYALRAVDDMGMPFIDQKLFKTIYYGLPSLESAGWTDLLNELSEDRPFSYLRLNQFNELAEIALAPSAARLTESIDPELRPFFEEIYSRPEMSDLVWLNTFRILSSRYRREQPCEAYICYLPADIVLITEIQSGLRKIGEKYNVKNDLGFITPFDNGKRCIWEYDFYFNHNDMYDIARIRKAVHEAGALLDDYSCKTGTVKQVRYVAGQGCCRKENLLYTSDCAKTINSIKA